MQEVFLLHTVLLVSDFIMVNTIIEMQAILKNYFKPGLKDTEGTHRIWEVEGNKTKSDCTAQNQFKCFTVGDLSLEIKSRSLQPSVINYDAFKT